MSRESRHRLVQKVAWSGFGSKLLKVWLKFRQRTDYVALNYSLHTPTNGELWLLDQLPTSPLVLDVGFNDGDYTREVLAARPAARVIAFDPARTVARQFAERFASDARLRFENVALSKDSGTAEFHDYGNMSSSLAARIDQNDEKATRYSVPVMTLDDFARQAAVPQIDLLKIDAEGHDLHVLEGASRLLDQQAIDMFMFEYADGWISSRRFLQEAVAYLARKPYYLFRLYNGFLAPFAYETRHENFGAGCMFVGLSSNHYARGKVALKNIPF